MSELLTFDTVI